MGANFTRRALTVGLIGASLAAAAPAGAVVADKNLTVRGQYAAKLSSEIKAGQPRLTPPNVARALRTDAQPTSSPSPVQSNGPRVTPPNVQRTLIADAQPINNPAPVDRIVVHAGFDWSDAALGAGGTLVLLAAAGGLMLVATRRRQRTLPIAG
jgi:hypothetical protein